MKIGWIGLGKMGIPMSEKLIEAGYELAVYNRTAEKVKQLSKVEKMADTPAELIGWVDVVFLMVSDDEAVRNIFKGDGGLLANKPSGKIYVNMSTVSPAVSREMNEHCVEQGSAYIDAPVSGSVKQAQEASLVVIAGGENGSIERVKPMLEKIGKAVLHVGACGAGNAAKLAVNSFLGIATQGLAEVITFAKSMDIKTEDLLGIINNSALGSPYIKIKGDAVLQDNYHAAFTLEHLAKDLRLAKASGLKQSLGTVAHDTFQQAESQFGAEDVMAIIKFIKEKN